MNPDKIFGYLDGTLDPGERAEIDKRLLNDSQLQREFAIAREIHLRGGGKSREVLGDDETTNRGRILAVRFGSAFFVLIALNVVIGLIFIAHKEASNPNRKLLDNQMRDQLTKSLAQAAQNAMPPPPLGVSDINVPVTSGKLDSVADQVVSTATRLGGSGTKGLTDNHNLTVLVDLPANREAEFRSAIATMTGGAPIPTPNDSSSPEPAERKSFVVRITEPATP